MKIYHTAADLVGRTPLLELGRIEKILRTGGCSAGKAGIP